MKLVSGVAALLIGGAAIGGGAYVWVQMQPTKVEQVRPSAPIKPLTVKQIDQIAADITVLIDATPSGSGVLIAKEKGWFGNTYYVLTAKHVVQGKNEFDVVTPDGERHRLHQQDVEYLPDVDLAVVKFASRKSYSLANLTTWDAQNRSMYFEGYDKNTSWVFVSGFPDPQQEADFKEQKRIFTVGTVVNPTDSPFGGSDSSLTDGYQLTYTAATYRGMSGSPILDTSGRLIGIHGRNTGEQIDGTKRIILGNSIGVPLAELLNTKSKKLQSLFTSLTIAKNSPSQTVDSPRDYRLLSLSLDFPSMAKTCKTSTDSCLNYISRLVRAGLSEDALPLIETYLSNEKTEQSYAAWYLRGRIFQGLGRDQEALSSFEETVRLNPNFYEARVSQCSLLWSRIKDYKKAVAACNQGIEIIKKLEKNGNLKVKPFNVWHQKAQALERLGRYKEAIETYTIAIEILPNPHSYLNRGANRKNSGDYKGALADYSKAVQLNPSYTQGYLNRGMIQVELDNWEAASKEFHKAASINPEYVAQQLEDLLFRLSHLPSANKEKDLALTVKELVRIYDVLIQKDNGSSKLSEWYLNRCRLKIDDVQSALKDCNKAIELNSNSFEAYIVKASLYRSLKNYQESINDYSKLITLLIKSETYTLKPETYLLMKAYGGRCQVYVDMKQYNLALQDCQKAIDIHPVISHKVETGKILVVSSEMESKSTIYWLAATIYSELGNHEMATERASQAIEMSELNGSIYIDRAAFRFQSLLFSFDKDTKKIIAFSDEIGKIMNIINDLKMASGLLKYDKKGKQILDRNIKEYIKFFSSIQQQDETVKTVLAELRKLE